MEEISEEVLRKESDSLIRRASAGEEFIITLHGRPTALLGPHETRYWISAEKLRRILSTPTDRSWDADLKHGKDGI